MIDESRESSPGMHGLVGEDRTQVLLNQQNLLSVFSLWGPEQQGTRVWRGPCHVGGVKAAPSTVASL